MPAAPAGHVGPDTDEHFLICEYSVFPNLLDSPQYVAREHFLQTFWEGTQVLVHARQALHHGATLLAPRAFLGVSFSRCSPQALWGSAHP